MQALISTEVVDLCLTGLRSIFFAFLFHMKMGYHFVVLGLMCGAANLLSKT